MWDQAYSMGFAGNDGPVGPGSTVLITGGTSGIGQETARGLAKLGAKVIIVGRDPARIEQTVAWLRREAGHDRVHGMQADLSSLAEVRLLAEQFRRKQDRLDVLVNNAGSMFGERVLTGDGFERTWALNHLAYFLLTLELLDLLKASAPARIVNVASEMHRGGEIDFENLQGEKHFACIPAYRQSKLANILFTKALPRRLIGTGVTANALHPGAVATGMGRDMVGLMKLANRLCQLFFLSPRKGAATSVYLASSAGVEKVTGKYFVKCRETAPAGVSMNMELQERLWRVSLEQTGAKEVTFTN
jgi:NAD(P)-dependent dehydrogenase (short-subunit alcohol dehydrogenase family)